MPWPASHSLLWISLWGTKAKADLLNRKQSCLTFGSSTLPPQQGERASMNQAHAMSAPRGISAIPGHGPDDLSESGKAGHALQR